MDDEFDPVEEIMDQIEMVLDEAAGRPLTLEEQSAVIAEVIRRLQFDLRSLTPTN